ncbi:MAG: type II toxin-antitoxin system VapC family toxin [Actinomycetota bacterium]
MSVFVDTSAIYALLSASDSSHARARRVLINLRARDERLITTSYVVVETSILVSRRMGMRMARALYETLFPLLHVRWVDEEMHHEGSAAWLSAGRRGASLVDWVSFQTMRREGVEEAFAFDPDFAQEGFRLLD